MTVSTPTSTSTPAQLPVVLKPSPLKMETIQLTIVPGLSIKDILLSFTDLPEEVWTHGYVTINGVEIDRSVWHRVKPKAGARHIVHIGVRLGDGGGGNKNIFAIIATIAIIVAAAAISGGALAGTALAGATGLTFAAGSTSAALLAAGVSIAGSLLLGALFPPPSPDDNQEAKVGGSGSIEGNVLEPFSPIPFVIGQHRAAPPHLILPWSEVVEDDTYVYGIVGLNGVHTVEDIWLNDAHIDDFEEVEYEIYDGFDNTGTITLVDKQVHPTAVNTVLGQHKVEEDNSARLLTPSSPSDSYPTWHNFRSRGNADEIWFEVQAAGLVYNGSDNTEAAGTAFRVEVKLSGTSTWLVLPEIHLWREYSQPFRFMVKLSWDTEDTGLTAVTNTGTYGGDSIWAYAFGSAPTESFTANSYFLTGSYPAQSTIHVRTNGKDLIFYMNESGTPFPQGIYDIRIKRGYAYRVSNLTVVFGISYELSGNTAAFFSHIPGSSPPAIGQGQRKLPTNYSISNMSSVFFEAPLTSQEGLTLIAIKAKNTAVRSISAIFTGHAPNWNGADWNTFEATRNPASWYRAIALGQQSIRPVFTEAQLDDSQIQDWHDHCETFGLNCDVVVAGSQSVGAIMQLIAATGNGVPRVADKVGVVYDYDRSAESPTQLFTQRNSAGLSIRRAFPRLPHGFRVKFNDADNDYKPTELFVYRPGYDSDNASDIEAITYDGITDQQKAIDRAVRDLRQLTHRATLYEFSVDIEHLYSIKGSLVALAHDTIRRHYDSARVVSVQTSGSNVTGITVDVPLRLSFIDDYDGAFPAGVTIQLKDGSTITHEINETGDTDTLTFATPFTEPGGSILEEFCLVVAGPFVSTVKRMLVKEINPNVDLTAELIVIDEAPIINTLQFAVRINADVNVTASVNQAHQLAAAISGSGDIAVDVEQGINLAAAIGADGDIAANLYQEHALAVAIGADGDIAVDVTVGGTLTDTGFVLAQTGASVANGSGAAWTSPGNIVSSNNSDANVTDFSSPFPESAWLRGSNFGLSIPGGATIVGIEVQIEAARSFVPAGNINRVVIGKDGSTLATEKTPNEAITGVHANPHRSAEPP